MRLSNSIRLAPAASLALPLLGLAAALPAAEPDELQEILVTATLRRQSLQEVPASVTVLDPRTLRDAGRQHFEDVLKLVPNLNWAGGTSRPRYFQIRGIGEREQYEGAPNPSVGFLIDDIDFSGLGMPATLFDVGQVEVLRGPQGTHRGANALAGLIVVRGEEPRREGGVRLEAGVGDYGTRSAGLAATGAADALDSAWRISLQKAGDDGFMKNTYLGRGTNDHDELTARVKWRWFAGEATQVDFTYLHADIDNGYDAWALDNSRLTLSDEPGEDSQRANGASLRVESTAWRGNQFTAIATYANSDSINSFDADWGNARSWAPYVYQYFGHYARERSTGTLELRLASPAPTAGGPVAWLAGAYAQRLTEHGADHMEGAWADPGEEVYESVDELSHRYRATNLALFGQLDGYLAERWRWSAGVRFEQRRARYADEGVVSEQPRASRMSSTDRMLGGQLSLAREFGEGRSTYLSLARGYKAGGFNPGVVADSDAEAEAVRRFDPEYLWNLEAGLHAPLGSGRGHASVSAFYQWRRDQQVRTGRQLDPSNPNSYVFVTDNLPDGYTTGLEAALAWRVLPSLEVGGTLGLLRSRSGAGTTVDDEGNAVPVRSREQAHAPGYTAAVHATWRSSRGLMARLDVTAMDAFYFDVPTDHDQKAGSHALAHLKAGYEAGRWSVHAWVRNLFNERYAVRGFYFSNEPPDWPQKLYTQLGEPRRFGITATLDF
jgi:iron complex outermembrane receptor protein